MDKEKLQEAEYNFPYHYLPSFSNNGPSVSRILSWGWEYLTYNSYLLEKIKEFVPKTILDVGCGDGFLLNTLGWHLKEAQLTGIDTSERAINFAKAFCNNSNVIFKVEDINNLSGNFDVVSLIEVIEHIPDFLVESFLKKSFSLSGKYVIISVPTTAFPLQSKHYRHYTEDLLSKQISFSDSDFELVSQQRLYSNSSILKFLMRVSNNRWFTINSSLLKKAVWFCHRKYSYFSSEKSGMHLVTVYRRKTLSCDFKET